MVQIDNNHIENGNEFYRKHFHKVILAFMASIVALIVGAIIILYQVHNRPIPPYIAFNAEGKEMPLVAFDTPNLVSSTLIRWATKAAVAAYTYDFYNYEKQLEAMRPYFTEAGWAGYSQSIQPLLDTISSNKLFVNSVVAGQPVISNQGALGDYERVWRIQIPFLVTYQGAESTQNANYMVTLMIVKVPTTQNPAAIAIDQFLMR